MVIKYLRDEDTSQNPKWTINSLDFSWKKKVREKRYGKLQTGTKTQLRHMPDESSKDVQDSTDRAVKYGCRILKWKRDTIWKTKIRLPNILVLLQMVLRWQYSIFPTCKNQKSIKTWEKYISNSFGIRHSDQTQLLPYLVLYKIPATHTDVSANIYTFNTSQNFSLR